MDNFNLVQSLHICMNYEFLSIQYLCPYLRDSLKTNWHNIYEYIT